MFFDRFAELCKEKGVKPTNACVAAGLSRGLASKWKSEKTEIPSAEALQKLSVYFGISIDSILGSEKQKTPAPMGERNIIRLVGRDGSVIEKVLTDEQLSAYKTMVDHLPEADDL